MVLKIVLPLDAEELEAARDEMRGLLAFTSQPGEQHGTA